MGLEVHWFRIKWSNYVINIGSTVGYHIVINATENVKPSLDQDDCFVYISCLDVQSISLILDILFHLIASLSFWTVVAGDVNFIRSQTSCTLVIHHSVQTMDYSFPGYCPWLLHVCGGKNPTRETCWNSYSVREFCHVCTYGVLTPADLHSISSLSPVVLLAIGWALVKPVYLNLN